MNTEPTSDEKITAALVHASVLLLFLGPIVPVLIWTSQRRKSKYVSFHALQAMGYQALIFWLLIPIWILIALLSVVLILPLSFFVAKSGHPEFRHIRSSNFCLFIAVWLDGTGFPDRDRRRNLLPGRA